MTTTLLDMRARQRKPRVAVTTPNGRPAWYPDDAVLTLDDVAAVLGIATKTVRGLGLKIAYATPHRPYVLYKWLVEFLEQRAA